MSEVGLALHSSSTRSALTPRDIKVLNLLIQDKSNREIANEIGSTESTVKNDMRRVMDKSGMGNRVELALWYVRHFKAH